MNKGVFTTMNNLGDNVELHYERLTFSSRYLGIEFNLPFTDFKQSVQSLCSNEITKGIRISVNCRGEVRFETRDYQPPKLSYSLKCCEQDVGIGIKLKLDPNPETSEGLQAATKLGYDDFAFSVDGYFTETLIANIYFIKGKQIFTPPLNPNILAGTVRARLLASGLVQERMVSISDSELIDGIFITNSIKGIQPVTKLNDISFKYNDSHYQLFGKLSQFI